MVEINGYKYVTVQLNFDSTNPEEMEIANFLLGMKKKKKKYLIELIKRNGFGNNNSGYSKEYITNLIREVIAEQNIGGQIESLPKEKPAKDVEPIKETKTSPIPVVKETPTPSHTIIDDDEDEDGVVDGSLKGLIRESISAFKKD